MADDVEHPLKFPLQFWLTTVRYLENDGTYVQTALGDVLKTIEDFYSMFQFLNQKTPFEKIKEGGYSVFKEGLEPNEESIPRVVRYFCVFPQCEYQTYLNFFLLIVSGKFENICGIYTHKHTSKPLKIEIWSQGDIREQDVIAFFGDKIPNLKLRKKKKKNVH